MKLPIGPVELLIIQGSPYCNLDCKYCYLPDRLNKKRISIDTIKVTLEKLLDDNLIHKKMSMVWHAGEPLAVPIAYYREIFEMVKSVIPEDIRIVHHFQTNGTLINQDWCDLFDEYKASIGISVDGPKHINDLYRLNRKNRSTFDQTMRGVQLLKKNNIEFHAIAVVTEKSLDYPDDIFNFFKDMGVTKLGVNIEEVEGIHEDSSLKNDEETTEKIYQFFTRLNNLQIESNKGLAIRELDDAKKKILQIPLEYFSRLKIGQQTTPYRIISVDVDGNFSSYSPELLGQESEEYNNFILGNVHETTFKEAAKTDVFKKFHFDIVKGIKKCEEECPYFSFCGGGAPANKFYENGTFDSTETILCKYGIKVPMDVVLEKIEGEIAKETV